MPDCSACVHNQPYWIVGYDPKRLRAYREDHVGCELLSGPAVCGQAQDPAVEATASAPEPAGCVGCQAWDGRRCGYGLEAPKAGDCLYRRERKVA